MESAGLAISPHSARRSTSAMRASPLRTATSRRVHRADRHPGGELGDRGLLDVDLAERGQHLLDVAQERAVRPDDEDAGAGQLAAVRVEQVGRPVQADGGLAGARARPGRRSTRSAGRGRCRPGRAGWWRRCRASGRCAGARSPRAGSALVVVPGAQELVLVAGELAAGEAEPAAPDQTLRIGRAGLVERPAHRRPPVDDDRVAGGVADVPAADVEGLGGVCPCGRRTAGRRGSAASARSRSARAAPRRSDAQASTPASVDRGAAVRISVRQSAARARWARSAVRTGSGTVVSEQSSRWRHTVPRRTLRRPRR